MKPLSRALLGLSLLAVPALADGFDPSVVPAQARRVVHVDVEGLQAGRLWKELMAAGLAGELDQLDEVREEFGIDPLKDVRSVTLFDTGEEIEHVAALLVTSASVDQALGRLRQEGGYHAVEVSGLVVHSWSDGDETRYAYVHERGPDERAVLLSDDTDMLIDGLSVLLGDAPSLASDPTAALTARPRAGAFLFAAISKGLPGVGFDHDASALLESADSAVLELGESGERLFVRASLSTATAEQATNLLELLQGLRALARLMGGDEIPPEAYALLDSIQLNQRDREVRLDFEIGIGDLLRLVEEH